MKREIRDYLQDIVNAMEDAMDFVKGMDYETFRQDTKTVYATIRAIEIIGETVKQIPDDIRKKYPEIPWKSIAGMRDKLIHAYFKVNLERVWETLKRDIPKLKPLFENILKDLTTENERDDGEIEIE